MKHNFPYSAMCFSNNSFRIIFIFSCLAFFFISEATGGTTGKIAGLVLDKSTGEPAIGANVYIEGEDYGAASDLDGYYFILNIPPGTYTLIVQMIGYQDVRINGVRVNVDLTTNINVDLNPEALEGQEVVVVAERPLIEKDLTSTSKNIASEEIKALPIDRFDEIVDIQAGVVAGHFRGGREGEVAYMVDGLPVNDPYNNEIGIEVENTSIQQLEVISGTFNAEYGQAMSGVVNIITREGGNKYNAEATVFVGSYYSNHDDVFPNIDKLGNGDLQNVQATISGPIPGIKKLKFFATYRGFKNDGYFFGRRLYLSSDNPTGLNPFSPSGDRTFVPLEDSKRQSFHGKLTFLLAPTVKLNYNFLWDDNENRYYNHNFRLVADSRKTHFRTNKNHNFILNHTLSPSTFHTLKISRNNSEYNGYVYSNPDTILYLNANNGQPSSNYTFRSGGLESDRYSRTTTTWLSRYDMVSQVNKLHNVGIGAIYKQHKLYNFWTDLDVDNSNEIIGIVYPAEFSSGREEYEKKPYEISAYIQDKIEYDKFIINAGLRFDYFDPQTSMPSDPKNPQLIPIFPGEAVQVDPKWQFSPRLGVAFPISSQGVIHVSYGHFFQIPNFEFLYEGITDTAGISKYYLPRESRLNTVKGNPDLKMQTTVMYEMGLQQALTNQLMFEFTAYYRDIRNLVGTEIIETYDVKQYARYINRDYANVTGAILSFEKRFANHWGARLDYTFQVAEGNSSDPQSVFLDNQTDPPRESEKRLVPLDWDQRHTLNLSLNTGTQGNWNIGLIGRFGSGTPYTAASRFLLGEVNFENNRTKPPWISFDLKADKIFSVKRTTITAYLWVLNLFDRLNEHTVYSSTGRANNDLEAQLGAGAINGLHTLNNFITNPGYYAAPRQIRFGFMVSL